MSDAAPSPRRGAPRPERASHAAHEAPFDAPRGGRLEIALLLARVLLELLLTPLHLAWFLARRRRHRAELKRALEEAAA